ncbi:MAG: leucyl aminopeptidase family protein [Deltaproteobacteria bacterium]|jgi:leucyl aminopeptidase|nr:leucyl aminopeptidase family protein [Deltaproteobacteria bacterium]
MNFKYKNDLMNGPVRPGTAIFLFEGDGLPEKRPELSSFRRCFGTLLESGTYAGRHLETVTLYFPVDDTFLVLVGLGKREELTEARLMEAAAKGASALVDLELKEGYLCLPPPEPHGNHTKLLGLMVMGARLGTTKQKNFKSDSDERSTLLKTKTLHFQFLGSKDPLEKPQNIINRADIMALAQLDARYLTDMPPNLMYPETFANEAKRLALRNKLRISVWDHDKLYREGAGGILAVGGGSSHPPALVIMEYDGKPDSLTPPVAIVGKGVTFDSGGLDLKPADSMLHMKTDMAGAAAVLAILQAVAELSLRQKVLGVIPLAENLTGSGAYRPGDVIKMNSGQTVEIVNTDAEGRLLLADGLTVAQKYKPSCLIDLATLTGACQVALGSKCAGIFSTDRDLKNLVVDNGSSMGEMFWELPLIPDYEEEIRSKMADFKQAGSRSGGAINAALFLKKFVRPPLPWVHLDICGPARNARNTPLAPEGATGFGVRTLLNLLTGMSLRT